MQDQGGDDIWWWHSIDLGSTVTPGKKSPEQLRFEWDHLRLDVSGRSVLDVGCWDGWFSFEAERAGATRVVAMDHFVWSLDLPRWAELHERCEAAGRVPPAPEDTPYWDPVGMPGRAGFDHAHRSLGSAVEPVVADFMTCDLDRLGRFDVVLYLGVLYHVEEPLRALRRLRAVTGSEAVIETEAVVDDRPICVFSPGLAADPTNRWVPSAAALDSMLRTCGFSEVEILSPPPPAAGNYRLIVKVR